MSRRIRTLAAICVLTFAFVFVPKESVAGPCLCELPCKAGCCLWCEIWSPEAVATFGLAGTAMVASIAKTAIGMVVWIEVKILPVWPSGFGKINAELMKRTASTRVMKEGGITVDTQLYMLDIAGAAKENLVPPAHLTTTVTNGLLLGEQKSIVSAKTTSGDAAFMMDFYSAKNVDESAIFKRHEPYCSSVDVARDRCSKAAAPTLQNADLLVNTVLNPGEGQYETLADEERDAAQAFVKNVVNPIPVKRLPQQQANTDQNRAYEAALLADQAALSLAAHSFNAIIANRTRRHQK